MLSSQNGDMNQTRKAIIGLNQFLKEAMNKDGGNDGNECKELQFSDNINLDKAIIVNGTQLQFLNTHGRLVDMSGSAQLMAKIYQNFTMMQAKGQLTTTSQQLNHIGVQLGLTNMLLFRTGTAHLQTGLTNTQIALISIGGVLVLVAIVAFFMLYNFK